MFAKYRNFAIYIVVLLVVIHGMHKKKIILFIIIVILALASAILLYKINIVVPPESCNGNHAHKYNIDYNTVADCRGGSFNGSKITKFEVYGGCGPNLGIGYWNNNPQVQTTSDVQLATMAAGKHCYCQIKSINGIAIIPYVRWASHSNYHNATACAYHCADDCVDSASHYLWFRSVLFSTLK